MAMANSGGSVNPRGGGFVIHADFSQFITPRVVKTYNRKLVLAVVSALNAALKVAKKSLIAAAERNMSMGITERDISAEFRASVFSKRALFALHFERRRADLSRVSGAQQVARGVEFTTGGVRRTRTGAFKIAKFGDKIFKRNSRGKLVLQKIKIRVTDADIRAADALAWKRFWAGLRRSFTRIERIYGHGGKFTAPQETAWKGFRRFPARVV